MTKPKNMTPEQEIAWKERDRARRSTPEYKEKAAIRARRWYDSGENKQNLINKNASKRASKEGRDIRNAQERKRYQENAEVRQKSKDRLKEWQATEHGKELTRKKSARFAMKKKIDREYEAFMEDMEGGSC